MVAPNDSPVDESSPSSPEFVDEGPQLTKEEKIKEIDRLMKDGRRAFLLQDFESATENFSVATEYSVSVYGEFAPETFDSHYEYGRSLMQMASFEIENAQAQFDGVNEFLAKKLEERKQKLGATDLNESAIGNPDDVPEEERQQVAEAVETALEENAAELEALAEQKAAETENPDAEEKTAEMETTEAEVSEEKAETGEQEKADEEMANEEEGEVARATCMKQESSQEWDLRRADVLHLLSQLSSLEEKFTDAIESLTEAVELRKKHLPSHDRVTASYLFEIGETWKQADNFLRASEYYALAEVALKDAVAELQKNDSKENEKDIAEIQGMLKEIADLIADCQESAKSHEQQKAAMAKTETPEKVKPPSDDENMEPAKEIAVVRKKRPAADAAEEPVKKAKVDSPTPAGDHPAEEAVTETA
ncbi:hypothetical protein FO519_008026 [Halicephalobus sp. NKZ332]|nr:hypothetical protein FO519_008026 [Halicephalobus sp. NKZ332]